MKISYQIKLTMKKACFRSKAPSGSWLRVQLLLSFCKIFSLRSLAWPRVLFCISDGVKLRTFPNKMENTNKFIPSLNIEWIEKYINYEQPHCMIYYNILFWSHMSESLTYLMDVDRTSWIYLMTQVKLDLNHKILTYSMGVYITRRRDHICITSEWYNQLRMDD